MYIIKRERQKKDLIKNFEKEVDYTLKNVDSLVGGRDKFEANQGFFK